MDRERDGDRRRFRDDRPPPPGRDNRGSLPPRPPMSPPRHRASPSYDGPRGGPRGGSPPPPPPPPKDPVQQLLDEIDRENRAVFVSQISSRLTSQDLGDFFVDMLGPKSVRDARVVMDKGRRSKGYVARKKRYADVRIAYVELDSVELLNKALSVSHYLSVGECS
jgi:RNA-binding protein 39